MLCENNIMEKNMIKILLKKCIMILAVFTFFNSCDFNLDVANSSDITEDDYSGFESEDMWETEDDFENTAADYSDLDVDRAVNGPLITSLNAIKNHINGNNTLTAALIRQHKTTIDSNIKTIGASRESITAAFNAVKSYETKLGPLFINSATKEGVSRTAGADIHTTIISIMQGIVDYVYTAKNLSEYDDLLKDFYFQSSKYFPGEVTSTPNPNEIHSVKINASYVKTFGHLIMHADLPARKPTGTYLAPGSIATVTVPVSMTGKGYKIRVGAHSYDLSNKPSFKRLDRSTILFSINNTTTKIASPLGGGIYIEVPYLKDAGIVTVQIKNAVRSPYFSKKSFHTTTLSEWQNVERNFGAPWADFQSEKVMIQVPTSWINKFNNPDALLDAWDKAVDGVSFVMGFPQIRGKEVLYLQVDVYIRAKAYSPGYPQVNTTYSPNKAYDGSHDSHLLSSPADKWSFAAVEIHELGHGHLFQKFPGETEAAVNFPFAAVLNSKFGVDLNEAFYKSFMKGIPFRTLDNAAITGMMTETFKNEEPMITLEMKYQYRGYGRYVDVARLFGWTTIDNYFQSINQEYENSVPPQNTNTKLTGNYDKSNNGLILRITRKAGVDLTPLIHFWGVQPNDKPALKQAIAAAGLRPSAKIYDTLVHYKSIIPANNQAIRTFILNWKDGKNPEAGTYEAKLWNIWDAAYATIIKKNVQNIINSYFPNGRP